MSGGFDFLVSCVEQRYDYQSARTMAKEAHAAAGLKQQDKYSDQELVKFADGLASVGSSLDPIWPALGQSPSGAPAPAPAAPAAAAAPAAEAKEDKKDDKKEEAKADKKDEAKSDKKDEAKDDKKDDGKDDGKDDKKDDGKDKGGKKK
jgi:hypothetical protein